MSSVGSTCTSKFSRLCFPLFADRLCSLWLFLACFVTVSFYLLLFFILHTRAYSKSVAYTRSSKERAPFKVDAVASKMYVLLHKRFAVSSNPSQARLPGRLPCRCSTSFHLPHCRCRRYQAASISPMRCRLHLHPIRFRQHSALLYDTQCSRSQ